MSKQESRQSRDKAKEKRFDARGKDAKNVGGSGDFGVPESDVAERNYTSRNTKRSDRGAAPARSGSDESRTSGVGGNNSGPGSSSGGDVDTDVIGFGRNERPLGGAGDKNEQGRTKDALRRGSGSTVQRDDGNSAGSQGADSAGHEADNDAFAGEVSSDEASGRNDAAD